MKQDPDYIAAVEKAISEKYGKNTAQDFRHGWSPEQEKEYLAQLQERQPKDKREANRHRDANRTCPVCKTYSFSGRDDLYMNRFSTCYSCYRDFVAPNPQAWQEGKRPHADVMSEILRRRHNGDGTRNS